MNFVSVIFDMLAYFKKMKKYSPKYIFYMYHSILTDIFNAIKKDGRLRQ